MSVLGYNPGMLWTDGRGFLTREAQQLLQQLVASNNGEGAGVTVDGQQDLTSKTIDGDRNALENIGTNSLKSRTGDDNTVVTGTAGTAQTIVLWDANGDAVGGPELVTLQTTEAAEEAYLSRDGSSEATGPVRLQTYTVATVPAAAEYPQGLIYVSDETGGATVAFSDATNWRRVQDRVVIS